MIRHLDLVIVCLFLVTGILSGPACIERRGATPSQGITVSISVDPAPPRVGAARLRLILRDSKGQPVTGVHDLRIEGTMTMAGMQPILATATEQGNGVYVVDQFRFTMAGDWVVIVRGTLANGQRFETQAPIPDVREDH